MNPGDGKLLWKMPYTTGYDQNTITPVIYRDLLIYSGYQKPLEALRVSERNGKLIPESIWENKDCPLYMSSPVVAGDRLYRHVDETLRTFLLCQRERWKDHLAK